MITETMNGSEKVFQIATEQDDYFLLDAEDLYYIYEHGAKVHFAVMKSKDYWKGKVMKSKDYWKGKVLCKTHEEAERMETEYILPRAVLRDITNAE